MATQTLERVKKQEDHTGTRTAHLTLDNKIPTPFPVDSSAVAGTSLLASGTAAAVTAPATTNPSQSVVAEKVLDQADIIARYHKEGVLHYSLNMSQALKDEWKDNLQDMVDKEIMALDTDDDSSTQLLLASRHPNARDLKPSIVVLCLSSRHQKKIRKRFNTTKWRDILKAKNLKLRVIVDNSFGATGTTEMREIKTHEKGDMTTIFDTSTTIPRMEPIQLGIFRLQARLTLCGAYVKGPAGQTSISDTENECVATMGGIVLVNGRLFGLTVAHPFAHLVFPHQTSGLSTATWGTASSDADESSLDGDDESLSEDSNDNSHAQKAPAKQSSNPFELSGPTDSDRNDHLKKPLPNSGNLIALGMGNRRETHASAWVEVGHGSSFDTSAPHSSDWALIEVERDSYYRNTFNETGSIAPTVIEGIQPEADLVVGKVWVISARTGVQAGILNDTPASVTLRRTHFVTRQIHLQRNLQRGDSGAWVVKDNKLCGVIIAGGGLLPWGYMLPIEHVFADILRTVGGKEIRVPSRYEMYSISQDVARKETAPKAITNDTTPSFVQQESTQPPIKTSPDSMSRKKNVPPQEPEETAQASGFNASLPISTRERRSRHTAVSANDDMITEVRNPRRVDAPYSSSTPGKYQPLFDYPLIDVDRFHLQSALLPVSSNLGRQYESAIEQGLDMTEESVQLLVTSDLCPTRLEQMDRRLWMAASTGPIQPLHEHVRVGRHIFVTEAPDMHLVYHKDRIFIKALPRYLMLPTPFQPSKTNLENLQMNARGLLNTYAHLIRHPIDLKIAHEVGLITEPITWDNWRSCASDILLRTGELDSTLRYCYGELDLEMLRFLELLSSWSTYESWVRWITDHPKQSYYSRRMPYENKHVTEGIASALKVFLFGTLSLGAMLVALSSDRVSNTSPFRAVSYFYSVVLLLLLAVGAVVLFSQAYYMAVNRSLRAVSNRRRKQIQRKKSDIFFKLGP